MSLPSVNGLFYTSTQKYLEGFSSKLIIPKFYMFYSYFLKYKRINRNADKLTPFLNALFWTQRN